MRTAQRTPRFAVPVGILLVLGGILFSAGCTRERNPLRAEPAEPAAFAPGILTHSTVFPLEASADNRHLVDQNGVPFLMAGDSPQALIVQLSEAEAELYCANREALGFNTIWVNLLARETFTGRANGSTYDGILPFTNPSDLSTPNEAYFARADRMIEIAAEHRLLVVLDPIETIDHLDLMVSNGATKCRNFGRYLGNRYRDYDNILWMSGNDYQTWPQEDAYVTAVAAGIRETDPVHIHTLLLDYFVSGSLDDAANWGSIIQLNASYTYYPTYIQVLADYNRPNHLPVFLGEATYEYEHNANAGTLRRQEYWSILSGATGQLYGNGYLWKFSAGWESYLNSPGAVQMAFVQALFLSRAWHTLVPDQNHSFVTAGYGTFAYNNLFDMNSNYATAAVSADGKLGMVYMPSSRTITVNLTKISGGQAKAWWYNPISGVATLIGTYPTTGSVNFTPTASGDWVLVLDDATLNLGPPGATEQSAPPTVVTPAAANPSVVAAMTTSLSVLGADDGGEPALTYTWAAIGSPPEPVSFSVNGTNAAKNTVAAFTKAGGYTLRATITDQQGQTAMSNVSVTVSQTCTAVTVTPASAIVPANGLQQFQASARDQFGDALVPQPAFTWTASGGGSISSAGLFTAGGSPGGPFTITASGGGRNGTASVTVSATNVIYIGETSILGIDDSGNANLLTAQAATLAQTATIQSLSFYVTTAVGKVRLGVYDATGPGGGPGTRKAETNQVLPVVGWNTATVTIPVTLPAGSYWLVFLANRDDIHVRRAGSGTCRYRSFPYGNLPSTFGSSTTLISEHWSFYATLEPEGGVNNPPTVATPAAASPNPVTGTSTDLSVLGADDGGEANLTYSWITTGTPPEPVTFSLNGTNAAKNTQVAFTKAGSYGFRVTIADSGGLTVTSNVSVVVNQTLTSIVVAPASASVPVAGSQQFNATARDQFGDNLSAPPIFTWTVGGGGSISSSGNFAAGSTPGGPFTVTAAAGGKNGTASVTVVASTELQIGETSILGIDDSGNANLLIAQSATLAQAATIQSMSFYVTTAVGKIRLGIYDATGSGGGPGTRKAETNQVLPVVGWNTAPVTIPVTLPAGNYWLVHVTNRNDVHVRRAGSGTCRYRSFPYDNLPATFGSSTTSISDRWSFYGTLIP